MTGDTAVDEQIFAKATEICEERFVFVDKAHPAMEALFALSVQWVAREIALGHQVGTASGDITLTEDASSTVDPVDILQEDMKLPSVPEIVLELQKVVDDPESSAEEVAAVVSKDASLSAFLLRLVNSAFYNFPSQIDTISRAVTVVGTKQLTTMAIGASVLELFDEVPGNILDIGMFWKHSIAVGTIARKLAEFAGEDDAERFFVCGLLHDLGRLALFSVKPQKALAIVRRAKEDRIPLYAAEARVLGFDHAKLGGMLLRKWNFPFSLTMGLLYHHLPEKSEKFIEPHIVHLADIIANGLGFSTSGEYFIPPMSEEAWNRIGLSVEQLQLLEKDLYGTLQDLFGVLFGDRSV